MIEEYNVDFGTANESDTKRFKKLQDARNFARKLLKQEVWDWVEVTSALDGETVYDF